MADPDPGDSQLETTDRLAEVASEIGFYSLGVAEAGASPRSDVFLDWIDKNRHATMEWLTKDLSRRLDPRLSVSKARSVIVVSLPHDDTSTENPGEARIARYALGRDYHRVMKPMLEQLAEHVEENSRWKTWYTVDSSPIVERDWAAACGIGWVGKNGMVIDQDIGSYFFLGSIVTDRPFHPTDPQDNHCGTCTRCIDLCPTSAIVEPGVLDSNRCISYLNIEHSGDLPEDTRLFDWLLGCDICQEVCPWNTRPARVAPPVHEQLKPRDLPRDPVEIASMSRQDWLDNYAGTPVTRTGYEGLIRNARKILEERSHDRS